jgi:deoxyribonuclease-4
MDGFRVVLSNSLVRSKPMILETPVDERQDDYGNLAKVRSIVVESLS